MNESQPSLTEKSNGENLDTTIDEQHVGNIESRRSALARTILLSHIINSVSYEVSLRRMLNLRGIMEALRDLDIKIIGVWGSDSVEKSVTVEKVSRRAERDSLFDVIVRPSVTQKPDLRRIQGEVAHALGFNLAHQKSVAKRATCLRDRTKQQQKILVMLKDLFKGLDLEKVGIPSGADHTGCKILLTSINENILSNQMHAQKVFMA